MLKPFTIHHGPGDYWQIEIPHEREWSEQWYALGHETPNFSVPAIRHKVCFYANGDCIEIRSTINSALENVR